MCKLKILQKTTKSLLVNENLFYEFSKENDLYLLSLVTSRNISYINKNGIVTY